MYLIYQPGKAASQTLEWSIRLSDEAAEVARHHYLSDEALGEIERICYLDAANPKAVPTDMASMRSQLLEARRTRERILNSDRQIFVLTGYRDPLDFAISAFFQNVTTFCPWLTFKPQNIDAEADRAIEFFNREFEQFSQRIEDSVPPKTLNELMLNTKFGNYEQWFDRELLGALGLNVFSHQVGAAPIVRFREGRFTVLLYRLETLRDHVVELLRELPIRKQVISERNIGATKIYSPVYARFRDQFVPSTAMMDYYYGGRYFKHFYDGRLPLYSSAG